MPQPACATPVTQNMEVVTESELLWRLRRGILKLLLSDHPLECLVCERCGDCELQDLAYYLGIKESTYPGVVHTYTLQKDNPFIAVDRNKCILCARCVRICHEVQRNEAISLADRAFDTFIHTTYDKSPSQGPCVFCGNCISTCPVGALTSVRRMGQGREWELKRTRTPCPYCGVGCQIILKTRDEVIVDVEAEVGQGVNNGNLCVKGKFGMEFVNHKDRLNKPLLKKDGEFVEMEWDQALDVVAQGISAIVNKYGPDSFAGLSSAKCTNEENYLFQKFMRAVVGTNNVDHCARL